MSDSSNSLGESEGARSPIERGVEDAIIIFVDVRGFTRFAEKNEIFANLEFFVSGFLGLLTAAFPATLHFFKPLGDGALIVRPVTQTPLQELTKILKSIQKVDKQFATHCHRFSEQAGEETDLRLGWGVVRGKVKRVGDDYASHNLNKCARLCGVARPFGAVIDYDDFPVLPKSANLFPRTFRLTGIGEVKAWVSPEIASTFLPREKIRETPEVHIAGLAIDGTNSDLRILLARRSKDRRLFPNLWEGCGGQLSAGESFTDGVRRHYREELGLEVQPIPDIHCFYEIREPDTPLIPGLRFLCKIYNRPPEIRSPRHSEIRWVDLSEFRAIPHNQFVGRMKDEALALIEQYNSSLEG